MTELNLLKVPEAREAIREVAATLWDADPQTAAKLTQIADRMYRQPRLRRAADRSPRMTAELRDRIKALLDAHPDAPLQLIAEKAGTNTGRISEVLHGLHDGLGL